ncbi:MAG TPA: M48 family metalloprotease [Candidatus Baltobacteraceae bacterium]|jgi:predicted Zn-dependent protease|nr:M48 family metalloprotease [Candidatus Baltobacteraceae bacterium]
MRFRRLFSLTLAFWAVLGAAALADTHADEAKMGRQVYSDLAGKDQIVRNSPYAAIVQNVGARIAAAAGHQWYRERFYIVRGNQMNAFSAPGGYVFVNEGLLRGIDNVDELANVLGHETAHLILGHVVARNKQAERRNMLTNIGHWFVNATSKGSQNTYNAATAASTYTFLGFTRQQEYDADRTGALLAARAGFNPWGSVWFSAEVLRVQGDSGYEQYVQQHPSTNDRIAHLKAYFKSNPQMFARWPSRMPSSSGLPMS